MNPRHRQIFHRGLSISRALIAILIVGISTAGAQGFAQPQSQRAPNTEDEYLRRLSGNYGIDLVQKAVGYQTDYEYFDITDRMTGRIYSISTAWSVDERQMERELETEVRSDLGLPGLAYDDKALDACYTGEPTAPCGGRFGKDDANPGRPALITGSGAAEQTASGRIVPAADGQGFVFQPY